MTIWAKAFLALLGLLAVCGCAASGGGGGGPAAGPDVDANANQANEEDVNSNQTAPAEDGTDANAQPAEPTNENADGDDDSTGQGEEPAPFAMTSTAFTEGEPLPVRHTGDGQDLSPPLTFAGVPVGAAELAVTVVDSDAPGGAFVHWIVYGVPAGAAGLSEGVPTNAELADPPGARQGLNGFGEIGYGGPLPPAGQTHHYVFTLYALDAPLDLEAGAAFDAFTAAIDGHVLAQTELAGTFTG